MNTSQVVDKILPDPDSSPIQERGLRPRRRRKKDPFPEYSGYPRRDPQPKRRRPAQRRRRMVPYGDYGVESRQDQPDTKGMANTLVERLLGPEEASD